ncbi:transglutaminase domain-containing protein, partial [bacterium]|nr:transglutaminase domain-containing protein [bacterium]
MSPEISASVVTEEIDSPLSKPGLAILFVSFLLAFPLYFSILLYFHFNSPEPNQSRSKKEIPGGKTSLEIRALPTKLELQPIPPIDPTYSTKDFLDKMVFVVNPTQSHVPDRLYLRVRSFENFSRHGMDSLKETKVNPDLPNFLISGERSHSSNKQSSIITMTFLRNFESTLPHPPTLLSLGGPQEFLLFEDGSIQFPATISPGDSYEIEFVPQPFFSADIKVANLPKSSVYLSVPFDSSGVEDISREAVKGAFNSSEKAVSIGRYIEKNFVYNRWSPVTKKSLHPVVDFLKHTKEGHCQHFAAGVVLLCRLNGIGARVAAGYLASRFPKSFDKLFVPNGEGHAWAEILTDKGWAILDVAVSARNREINFKPSFPLPTTEEIKRQIENEIEKNKKIGSGRYREEGESLVKLEKEADLTENSNLKSPPRVENHRWPEGSETGKGFKPQVPGSLSKNPELTKKHLKIQAKKEKTLEGRYDRRIVFSAIIFIIFIIEIKTG